jgi:sodium/bile acid cotransporter 7
MLKSFFIKYWFLFGIAFMLILGLLTSEWDQKLNPSSITRTTVIIILFFISGLTLPTESIINGIRPARLHLYIQSFIFLVTPLYFVASSLAIKAYMDESLYIGIIALACLPTTISSCIIFTQLAGGNVVGTMFNASLANIAGVFISPLLISFFLTGAGSSLPTGELLRVLQNLALKMLLPILGGQLATRLFLKSYVDKVKIALRVSSSCLVLVIIYFTIAGASDNPLFVSTLGKMAVPFVYLAVSHLALLSLAYGGARLFRLSRKNIITVLYAAPQKTVAMGVPLMATYFVDDPALLGMAILPLLFYHTWQLIVAGVLRNFMERRLSQVADSPPPP